MSPDRAAVGSSARSGSFTRVNSAPRDLATRVASISPPVPPSAARPSSRPLSLSSSLARVTKRGGFLPRRDFRSCAREPLRRWSRRRLEDYEIARSPPRRGRQVRHERAPRASALSPSGNEGPRRERASGPSRQIRALFARVRLSRAARVRRGPSVAALASARGCRRDSGSTTVPPARRREQESNVKIDR